MSTGTIRRVGGDTNVADATIAEWDTDDPASVARAREVYETEAAKGGLMARCDAGTDLNGEKLEAFDPDATEILSFGHPVGG